jgi:hypothetical protein
MEYDWAPCPKCGWKQPGAWEEASEEPEEGTPASRHAVLSSPKKWVYVTAWAMVLLVSVWLISFLLR